MTDTKKQLIKAAIYLVALFIMLIADVFFGPSLINIVLTLYCMLRECSTIFNIINPKESK